MKLLLVSSAILLLSSAVAAAKAKASQNVASFDDEGPRKAGSTTASAKDPALSAAKIIDGLKGSNVDFQSLINEFTKNMGDFKKADGSLDVDALIKKFGGQFGDLFGEASGSPNKDKEALTVNQSDFDEDLGPSSFGDDSGIEDDFGIEDL